MSVADSWIVAAATSRHLTIVTYEVSAKSAKSKVKIPDAAEALGVPCIDPRRMCRNGKIVVG
ncbi:DUF4411 family protein [Corynebacterium sp. CCM 8862]|uniref:DUF4411 family protein n=1 Tax=Corynebacterium mendelii TaxID=2765362 RepID=A0A939E2A1_9CORY|nr:DUF4411 family protein [Corynebacterium mendelii]